MVVVKAHGLFPQCRGLHQPLPCPQVAGFYRGVYVSVFPPYFLPDYSVPDRGDIFWQWSGSNHFSKLLPLPFKRVGGSLNHG